MTDSLLNGYQRWLEQACRQAELIGAIRFWANAPVNTDGIAVASRVRALKEIRQLVADFDAEQAAQQTKGGERR